MVIVFAGGADLAARALVEAWPGGDATLMTPASLARPGWVWRNDDPAGGTFVAGTQPVATREVAGVVSLLGGVHAGEIVGVDAGDVEYAAAEVHAFMLAWLHALACPRLNPPSLQSLNGELDPIVWHAHALAVGLPSAHERRPIDAGYGVPSRFDPDDVFITCVGDRVVGAPDEWATRWARALADSTRLPMFTVVLRPVASGYAFVHASARPNCADPDVARSIVGYFSDARTAS